MRPSIAAGLIALGLVGCGPAGGPAEGRRLYTADLAPNPGSGLSNPDAGAPADAGGDPDCPAPTLAALQEQVLLPYCSECHAGPTAPEGLDLSLPLAELSPRLAQAAHGSPSGMPLVAPGRRGGSFLYLKVFLETPLSGARMPKDRPALTACQLDALGAWIDSGAPP